MQLQMIIASLPHFSEAYYIRSKQGEKGTFLDDYIRKVALESTHDPQLWCLKYLERILYKRVFDDLRLYFR